MSAVVSAEEKAHASKITVNVGLPLVLTGVCLREQKQIQTQKGNDVVKGMC